MNKATVVLNNFVADNNNSLININIKFLLIFMCVSQRLIDVINTIEYINLFDISHTYNLNYYNY